MDHLARLEQHHTAGTEHGLCYRVVFQKVNAADFGVPQYRERVVIAGFRSDIQEPWSFPQPTHSADALEAAKWLNESYWDEHQIARAQRPRRPEGIERRLDRLATLPFAARWRTVRDALSGLPHPQSPEALRIPNHRFQPGARRYVGHTGSLYDNPAKTLKAGDHGVPGGENMLAYYNGMVRDFTIRESARLQTFPDWYLFSSSWTESMRQIGNAVPVTLARVIGVSIGKTLRAHERRTSRNQSQLSKFECQNTVNPPRFCRRFLPTSKLVAWSASIPTRLDGKHCGFHLLCGCKWLPGRYEAACRFINGPHSSSATGTFPLEGPAG